ncbi:MAG: hypothetical protein WCF57_02280 [Pyrinomonadaceae bacterium]
MRVSPQTPDSSQCHICRAAVAAGSAFCAVCGAQVNDPSEELRAVIFLLSELPRWEATGIIGREQAAALRQSYERRRDELRARLASKTQKPTEATGQTPPAPEAKTTPHAPAAEADAPDYAVAAAFSQFLKPPSFQAHAQKPRRTLIETLADPYTLRLLLYTGAAMLVVGIVIWLRDVLYLKLQEPVVQAALLAFGTISVTAAGWYTILRTRQRLTGRALTLIGSVLVPINFWFLVRSGLIANNGRAWVVCALCAMLYAHTAALLRERLYIYLACIASIATAWALVFRTTPDAFGLYALTWMGASVVFLHLSRLFPPDREIEKEESDPAARSEEATNGDAAPSPSRLSYELWGSPLVFTGLVGATLSALLYMPLRLWPSSSSLYDGIFRLHANVYDPSVAILLFAAAAYVVWFTGRYIFTQYRVLLYTLSTLALFWTLLLTLDGLLLSASVKFLALTATTLAISAAARIVRVDEASRALHRAALLLSIVLAFAPLGILFTADLDTMTHSAALACLAFSFALLSAPRFCGKLAQATLAHASGIFASLAFLAGLGSASLQSETLFVAACAAWAFLLYTCAQFARRLESETQLAGPFVRIADAEFVLLFLWASLVALLLHVDRTINSTLRPSMFCALLATLLYGTLRGGRDHSAFGASLLSLAALVIAAGMLDALQVAGLWPASWPVAAGVICAAFLLRKAAPGLLQRKREGLDGAEVRPLDRVVHFVMDGCVIVCGVLWFVTAVFRIDEGGRGAAFVLLLALLYWIERAAQSRLTTIAHLAAIHAGELFIALLIALRVDTRWFAAAMALILFPVFFASARYARQRHDGWLTVPVTTAAVVTLALAFLLSLLHAAPHLRPRDPLLLAPLISLGSIALVSFCASLLSHAGPRVRYFRAGLSATIISLALGCLRAGFDPISDIEIYTSPVAVLLLAIAYLSARRAWEEYDRDTDLLLWFGSLLLCVPLLFHALYFRLLLDVPAVWRDLGTLCASLALILFGALGRLRAPVLVGVCALTLELSALTLTSVDWLQVPLKYYLVTVGALMVIVFGTFEYLREKILLARRRFNEQRDYARERFGEWR